MHPSIILYFWIITSFPKTGGVLEQNFSWKCFYNINICFRLPSTTGNLQTLQVETRDSNSRLVVDEDYNGKFRLESVLLADHITVIVKEMSI